MRLILTFHVIAGSVALLSGATALSTAKGHALHRKSGILFVYAMIGMCAGGLTLALSRVGPWSVVNSSAALMTAYLVITSLTTVRSPTPGTPLARWLPVMALALAVAVSVTDLALGVDAVGRGGRRNGVPAFPFFLFGIVGTLASIGDVRVLRAGALNGAARLARHLWRMTFALFIATMSFFIGQAKVFPKPMRIPALLALPVLAVLASLLYWMWRVRIRRSFRWTWGPSLGAPARGVMGFVSPARGDTDGTD